jgi:hypothetical protein
MKYSQIGLIILLLMYSSISYGQIKPESIRLSVFTEAIAIPSYKLIKSPIHPGILVGIDFFGKFKNHWKQTIGADLSYYYHRTFEHAIMLDATYSIGYSFKFGLQPKLLTSLGYKHSILTGTQYKFESGQYEKATNLGKPQVNLKLGFGLEYPISEKIAVNIDYRIMVVYPYAPKKDIPMAPHSIFGIGAIMKINNTKKLNQ